MQPSTVETIQHNYITEKKISISVSVTVTTVTFATLIKTPTKIYFKNFKEGN